MHSVTRSSIALAACLSGLAGYIDAIGFLQLSGYFVSFMSGNTTRLAVALQSGDFHAAGILGGIIFCFVIGAMFGALIGHFSRVRRRPAILGTVAFLLALAAILSLNDVKAYSVICMTLAMGIINALFQRDGNVVIGLTYMTGTLVKVGQKLAAAITGPGKFLWLPYLCLWFGLLAGGVAGALAYTMIGLNSLWLGSFVAFGLALLTLKHRHEDNALL